MEQIRLEANVDFAAKVTSSKTTKSSNKSLGPNSLDSKNGKENVSAVFVERGAVVATATMPEEDCSLCESATTNVNNPCSDATTQQQESSGDQNLKAPPHVIAKMLIRDKKMQQQQQQPFKERSKGAGMKNFPPHIKVPPKNAFRYPERYRSPTDALVSPVSRGLLTRNKRPARTLAPVGPPKALESSFEEEANVDTAVDSHPAH